MTAPPMARGKVRTNHAQPSPMAGNAFGVRAFQSERSHRRGATAISTGENVTANLSDSASDPSPVRVLQRQMKAGQEVQAPDRPQRKLPIMRWCVSLADAPVSSFSHGPGR